MLLQQLFNFLVSYVTLQKNISLHIVLFLQTVGLESQEISKYFVIKTLTCTGAGGSPTSGRYSGGGGGIGAPKLGLRGFGAGGGGLGLVEEVGVVTGFFLSSNEVCCVKCS
jgi:hypothetical protein